jgi:hypothetical protein
VEVLLDILCLCSLAKSKTATVLVNERRLKTPALDGEGTNSRLRLKLSIQRDEIIRCTWRIKDLLIFNVCFRELLSLIISWVTDYPDWRALCSSWVFLDKINAGWYLQTGNDQLSPNPRPFTFHCCSSHLIICYIIEWVSLINLRIKQYSGSGTSVLWCYIWNQTWGALITV